jgi:hypothetical protein
MAETLHQQTKNRFYSLPKKQQLETIVRYVDRYHGGSVEELINQVLESNLAGELVENGNIRF